MAFGPDGALYVADHINNRVRRIDTAGIITTIAGSGPAGLDLGSFSGDGGQATSATLQEPTAVAFDSAGNLYISDRDNNRIRKVDPHGVISTIAGNGEPSSRNDGVLGTETSLRTPYGVVADAKGDVILVDGYDQLVRMVDPHGIISTIAGTGVDASTGDGGLATKAAIEPQYVAVDAAGNLYVTDDFSRSLRRIDRRGIITTVAGNGDSGPPRDGLPARMATFAVMSSPAFDGAGNLYVTDLTSVYRIDESCTLTRVAGKRP
jgi:streptogramin lyase